jgi:hypothetical protein
MPCLLLVVTISTIERNPKTNCPWINLYIKKTFKMKIKQKEKLKTEFYVILPCELII